MNAKLKIPRNTPEEELAINRGIAEDPDAHVPTDEEFALMKRRGGRPKLANPKVMISLRCDADIIEAFKSAGDGWQTRMNGALREWLQTHKS